MAVREFDGVDDDLVTAAGGLSGMQYGTVAVLVQFTETVKFHGLFTLAEGGNSSDAVNVNNDDEWEWYENLTNFSRSAATITQDAWYLLVARKATGTVAPRFSIYDYTAGSWTHGDGNGTVPDWSFSVAWDAIGFAREGTGSIPAIRVAARAAWSNSLGLSDAWTADASGDSAIEAAGLETHLSFWAATDPDALWAFNQDATTTDVVDLTGNGADQTSLTGTSVVTDDDPPGFSFEFEPVREFDGVDDNIIVTDGALETMEYGTVVLLVKLLGAADDNGIFNLHNSGDSWGGGIRTRQTQRDISWYSGGDNPPAGGLTLDEWYLVVARKSPSAGGNIFRVSQYNLETDQWAHGETSSVGNWDATGAGGYIAFRRATGDDPPHIRIGARAAWSNSLPWAADIAGDATIEAAGLEVSLDNWDNASPDALWAFNQSAVTETVSDLTGGGADQISRTGTTVITNDPVPGFSFDIGPVAGLTFLTPATVGVRQGW